MLHIFQIPASAGICFLQSLVSNTELSALCRKVKCLKFPKGIHVYRKINDDLSLIPKELYVKMLTNDI